MTMSPRYPKVTVRLVGEDGNAFAVVDRVDAAFKKCPDLPRR
jgi:hypothetical protein